MLCEAVGSEGHPSSFYLNREGRGALALLPLPRQRAYHPPHTHTCVRVLHQTQDHTRLFIDVEAQAILFLGHVDDEVGIGVHWEYSTESITLGVGLTGPIMGIPQTLPGLTASHSVWQPGD